MEMIEARILKIEEKPSKDGGTFYYFFFKDTHTGKSYRSCVYSAMRNYAKWAPVVKEVKSGKSVILSGLIYNKDRGVIDADSDFKMNGKASSPIKVTISQEEPIAPQTADPPSSNAREYIKKIRAILENKGGEG